MNEQQFWERRYAAGGDSGPGSVGEINDFHWRVIREVLGHEPGYGVLDAGCGDTRWWGERDCVDYLGVDWSPTALALARARHPNWTFIELPLAKLSVLRPCNPVICMNVLFHIEQPEHHNAIVRALAQATTGRLFIGTWVRSWSGVGSDCCFFHRLDPSLLSPLRLTDVRVHSDGINGVYCFKRPELGYWPGSLGRLPMGGLTLAAQPYLLKAKP